MNFKILQERPILNLVFVLNETELANSTTTRLRIGKIIDKIQFRLSRHLRIGFRFRGVEFSKLEAILQNGLDVFPTTSVIYTSDDPSKSMEYGWEDTTRKMILLMYDASAIKGTYQEIPAKTPDDQINKLMETYPTKECTSDGTIWLSRLGTDDKRRATPYEVVCGGWIPSDPFAALLGMIFIGDFREQELINLEATLSQFRSA